MAQQRGRGRIEVEGLVCYTEDDPWAEVAIATDYGQEFPVVPAGAMNSPFQWIDSYVHVVGQFVTRDGRRYLSVDRIGHVQEDWAQDPDDLADLFGGGSRFDDGEDEHEDYS